jgi:hypothetical protein
MKELIKCVYNNRIQFTSKQPTSRFNFPDGQGITGSLTFRNYDNYYNQGEVGIYGNFWIVSLSL